MHHQPQSADRRWLTPISSTASDGAADGMPIGRDNRSVHVGTSTTVPAAGDIGEGAGGDAGEPFDLSVRVAELFEPLQSHSGGARVDEATDGLVRTASLSLVDPLVLPVGRPTGRTPAPAGVVAARPVCHRHDPNVPMESLRQSPGGQCHNASCQHDLPVG